MRVLQMIPIFSPARGGAVTVMCDISKHLVKNGHDITILTTDFEFDHQYATSIKKEGVKVIQFCCITTIGLFLISPSMKEWLKKNLENYDIVHMHLFRSYQNNVAHYYAKKYKIPYVLQAHGSVLRIIEKAKIKFIFDKFFGYNILRDASKVIAVSNAEQQQYLQMGVDKEKICTIPNGLNLNLFKNLPEKGAFKQRYDLNQNTIILFVGRLYKRKGVDVLIKSFAELKQELEDIVLVLVGPDGGYKAKADLLIDKLNLKECVRSTGYVSEIDKLSAYVDADVLVYPSLFEIFGLVPFEAIMCDTPVIVADDCGCGEFIRKANCGYLVKYGDVKELKDKMKLALGNPEEAKMMVKRGQSYIEENLTWEEIVRKIERMYKDCIRRI